MYGSLIPSGQGCTYMPVLVWFFGNRLFYINCCTSLSLLLVLPLSWFPYLSFTYLVLIYVASVYATDAGLGILMSTSTYARGCLDQY